jgi:hypothetical protein
MESLLVTCLPRERISRAGQRGDELIDESLTSLHHQQGSLSLLLLVLVEVEFQREEVRTDLEPLSQLHRQTDGVGLLAQRKTDLLERKHERALGSH